MRAGTGTVPDVMGTVDPSRVIPPPLRARTVARWGAAVTAGVLLLAFGVAAVDGRTRPRPPDPDAQLVARTALLDGHAARGDCEALAAEVRSGRSEPGVPATEEHTRTALAVEYALAAMHRIGCSPAVDVSAPDPSGPMAGTNRVARF